MNNIIRWSLTAGLLFSPLSHLSFMQANPVFALPRSEVVEFLSGIPVYTLLSEDGLPIGRQMDNGSVVTPIFMSRREAEAFAAELVE